MMVTRPAKLGLWVGHKQVSGAGRFKGLERIQRVSVADPIFDRLNRQILTLVLLPGTKLSEVDVAQALGVSRQPVRDAFYRLFKLGFLTVRPLRATIVALISERSVKQAQFLRTAIELETVRAAFKQLTVEDLAALTDILDEQEDAAGSRDAGRFHRLDEQFHREIGERAGHGFVWDTIREAKAHMDRVRYLSLSFGSDSAYRDHREILAAIKVRNVEAATTAVRTHPVRILDQIVQVRASHSAYFAEED